MGDTTNTATEVAELGVVIYTDGSAKPNPGFIGSGVYGYTYDISNNVVKIVSEGINYYSTHGVLDASKQNRHQYSGITPVEPVDIIHYSGAYGDQVGTNNLAEILALSEMLEKLSPLNPKTIRVLADSQYVLKGVEEWCSIWLRQNWLKKDGTPVANRKEWERLYKQVLELKARGCFFEIIWVRGHSDVYGNTHADYLAGIGSRRSTAKIKQIDFRIEPFKKFGKCEFERNPLISNRRIYFNTQEDLNDVGLYFQGDPGVKEENIAGKRTPDATFSVVKLTTPDPLLEQVKQQQFSEGSEYGAIMVMRLERVYHKSIQPYLEKYGMHSLARALNQMSLLFPIDNKPVTLEMNPPGLTLRVFETFSALELILETYVRMRADNKAIDDRGTRIYDITDRFFSEPVEDSKKKKTTRALLKSFDNQVKTVEVKIDYPTEQDVQSVMVPLVIGMDTLPRNNLKKLENHNPVVSLITWRESVNSIRYATIVECDLGVGVWSNYHSDRIFFKRAGGRHAKK